MEPIDRRSHWESIYSKKLLREVSWYQPNPKISLDLIQFYAKDKTSAIIDIGGGDSLLADHLLKTGFTNITVLDISASAIERAKTRLGADAEKVKWIVSDVTAFHPEEKYDIWHDRAAFHFLTDEESMKAYLRIAHAGISESGVLIVGTFSEQGPDKCSGIQVKQYSEQSMSERFSREFTKIKCITTDHTTPFNTVQNYIFCSFNKRKNTSTPDLH